MKGSPAPTPAAVETDEPIARTTNSNSLVRQTKPGKHVPNISEIP